MTTPLPGGLIRTVPRANWLGRYLAVEQSFDKEIRKALGIAAVDTENRLLALASDNRVGAKTRALQHSLARNTMRDMLGGLFGNVGNVIRSFRGTAAAAAVDASLYDELPLLAKFFKSKEQREQYSSVLRSQANRNVEATIVRVLGISKNPLSKRVYRTEALSKGLVDNAINNALSRGDSARDLAKSVRNLIDPNVPGGVSYAAMRLGRTEINNAFHAQSIKDGQDKPWVQEMRWHLSKVHSSDPKDLCEAYAIQGLFPINHVPNKPHPQCRCFVTPELEDYDNFQQKLLGGQYDSYLDSILDAAGAPGVGGDMLPPKGLHVPVEPPKPVKTLNQQIEEAVSPEEIGNLLRDTYPNVDFKNFDHDHFDINSAKEIGQSLDRCFTLHPEGLRTLKTVEVWSDGHMQQANAHVQPWYDGTTEMRLNVKYTKNYDEFLKQKKHTTSTKWHAQNSDKLPWGSTIIHEYGHVLDWYGGQQESRKKLFPALKKVYQKHREAASDSSPFSKVKFERWIRGDGYSTIFNGAAPSKYSVYQPDDVGFNTAEIIAESFSDVVRNGEKAKDTSKAVHAVLMREVKARNKREGWK